KIASLASDLPSDVLQAGAGAVAAYLTGQLVDALGLHGTIGGGTNTVLGTEIGTIAENLTRFGVQIPGAAEGTTYQWNTGLDSVAQLEGAIGSFVGAKLAELVYSPSTVEGQIGASVGSAVVGAAAAIWGTSAVAAELGIDLAVDSIAEAALSVAVPL